MPRTKIDLHEEVRTKVIPVLNKQLAGLIDLQLQVKQAHWNIKGANFIAVHELLDDVYGGVTDYVDLVAERAVQLGGFAEGTVQRIIAHTPLETYPTNVSESSLHVDAISNAIAKIGKGVRAAIDETSELGDAGTADILTEISRGLDKWLWFVEAHNE